MATKKQVKKAAKKHPRALIAIVVILVVVVAVAAVLYFTVDKVRLTVDELIKGTQEGESASVSGDDSLSGGGANGGTSQGQTGGTNQGQGGALPHANTYGTEDLTFHFLELGNNFTGDSIYVRAGDIDILIDAGSRQNSADDIADYVNRYCTDGTLEYVIATHAHQDHIAGFVDTTKNGGGIFTRFQCEVIIDFAQTNATSSVYSKYVQARDAEVAAGAKHYTALECCQGINGAQKTYELGEGMSMTVLYQRYYEEKTDDENDYSVCVLFNHGENYYLFTGDLEAKGEASLVQSNTLPEVQLFKAGHHGSYTASSDALLSVIKPKIVCVCCCAGAVEYTQTAARTFPSQDFIDRVAPYTDKVYVTTVGSIRFDTEKQIYADDGFASMNGVITVVSSGGDVTVTCSNNDTLLKDTEWFKKNRTKPPAWAAG